MIRVTLINPSDRRFWQAQWADPVTGRTRTKSTKTTLKREAERFAARLETELNQGSYAEPVKLTCKELCERFLAEVSASRAVRTRMKTEGVVNSLVEYGLPLRVDGLADPRFISGYAAAMRSNGSAEYTIRGHLAEIRKILRWAERMRLLRSVPYIDMPKPVQKSKGRPITDAEFVRLVDAIPQAQLPTVYRGQTTLRQGVPTEFIEQWQRYLKGLFLSGLRLEESMLLHWTDPPFSVDLTGRRPKFRIEAIAQKSRKRQLLPMTPDFHQFILEDPDRTGYVFNPLTYRRGGLREQWRPKAHHVGRVVTAIGQAAGILVSDSKYASAHDLRRAFGHRWSKLVLPAVLQKLMRHESIQTTMEFYVGDLSDDSADAAFAAMRFD